MAQGGTADMCGGLTWAQTKPGIRFGVERRRRILLFFSCHGELAGVEFTW